MHANTPLQLSSARFLLSLFVYLRSLSWKLYALQWQYKGPLLPLWLFSLTLIFCPSRGRGLVLSCLSARQFYLSIAKPSTVWQRPQHCINPLSAIQPSITLLSIMSDPSSAHLSHTAHPLSWSPQSPTVKSQRVEGTARQEEIRRKCTTQREERLSEDYTPLFLPSPSLSQYPAESTLSMSIHAY